MNAPTRLAWALVAAVALLQIAWQGLWPAPGLAASTGWILTALPWLPLLLAWLFGLRHSLIYAGIPMLIWFCHGVMEAWMDPQLRGLALLEAALSAGYFGALYWRRGLSRVHGSGPRTQ